MNNSNNPTNRTENEENLTLEDNPLKSKTGKNKTIWQALNEAEDEDILNAMEAINRIGVFLDCRKEYELYEYREALQGWSDLNFMFNHEARARIEEYADMIEAE